MPCDCDVRFWAISGQWPSANFRVSYRRKLTSQQPSPSDSVSLKQSSKG